MVIDSYRSKPQQEAIEPSQSAYQLASPLDRLAAGVVDFLLVLTPLLVAMVAPLKRMMYESLINDSHSDFAFAIALGCAVIFAVTYLYQTTLNTLYGATLGKLAFGLRVVDVWTQKKAPWSAQSTRSLILILEGVFLGIPWLATLSHPLRRTIHDRVSDTIVVTLNRKGTRAPTPFESSFVAGVFAAILATFCLVAIATADRILTGLHTQDEVLGWLGNEQNRFEKCDEVTDAIGGQSGLDPNERLETSMELFAAGLADQECLRKEADTVLYSADTPPALAYLAKAFAQSDDEEISNEYLTKACQIEPDSEACQMTSIVQNWSNEDWKKVANLFAQLPAHSAAHVLVWKLRYFIRQGQNEQALNVIDLLSGRPALSSFIIPERTKALWRANRLNEARLVATTAFETLAPEDRMSLSGWMCYEELTKSCSEHLPVSCERLVQDAHSQVDQSLSPVSWLAMTLIKENCEAEGRPKVYQELQSVVGEGKLSGLLEAALAHSLGQIEDAKSMALKIVADSEAPDTIRGEAIRRLIGWSKSQQDLNSVLKSWRDLNVGVQRNLSGLIYNTLRAKGYLAEALDIGWGILNENRMNAELNRELVVVAYQLGRRKDAWSLLKSYRERSDLLANGRTPATVDDFVSITKMLNHQFGAQ